MNHKSKLIALAFFLALTFSCLFPTMVFADTAAPNVSSINETYAWRNVLETADFFLVARYNVSYGTVPPTDISETFLFRLMDTANVNELGVVEAYPYQNSGYGQGVVSWYFPAATAPTWGQPYWIKIQGKLTVFTSPPVTNYNISNTAYSALTDSNDAKADVATKILAMARTIGNSWSPAVELTDEVEVGTILSTDYGEAYFRAAIPGLQSMCPSIFLLQVGDPDADTTTWTNTQATVMENKVKTTQLGFAIQSVADVFGMGYMSMSAIPILIGCVVLIIAGAVTGNVLAGLVDSGLVISTASWAGWFPPVVMAIIAFLCVVFIGFHLIWKSS